MKFLSYVRNGAALLAFFIPLTASATTYYVAPTGSDTAAGSLAAPFASWAHAQSVVKPGDTVYFRGGTYTYTDATSTCASQTSSISDVVLTVSGTAGNMINYFAYPGETPVFDFSGVNDTAKYSCRQIGVNVKANYLHLRGLEFKGVLQLNNQNHESWCVYLTGGSYNLFEQLDAHHNEGPGFFIQQGTGNTFLNCDSHENEDMLTSNGDGQSADGFGCHPTDTGGGNLFHGCRAWWNSDDGWDFIHSSQVCTVEYSWSWYHGYKPDTLQNGQPVALAAGNGNGFKGGGYDMPPTGIPATPPLHILQKNASFYNKAAGFYANHSPISQFFYNNTGYHNNPDFNMLGVGSDNTSSISVGTLRNNLAFAGALTSNMNLGGSISDEDNSWDTALGVTVAATDFQNVDFAPPASCPAPYTPGGTVCVPPTDTVSFAGMASARNGDGSLPDLPFLHLATGSDLIDKGVDVGLPYAGKAPDLGCFETGLTYDGSDGGASSSSSTGGVTTSSSSSSGAATSSSSSGVVATSSSSSGGRATSSSSSGGADTSSSSSGGAATSSSSSGGEATSTSSSGTAATSTSSSGVITSSTSSSGAATMTSSSSGTASTSTSSGSATSSGASSSGTAGGGGNGDNNVATPAETSATMPCADSGTGLVLPAPSRPRTMRRRRTRRGRRAGRAAAARPR